jgi:hypothetical protein
MTKSPSGDFDPNEENAIPRGFRFGNWNLELGIYLEFGAWDLEFKSSYCPFLIVYRLPLFLLTLSLTLTLIFVIVPC